MATEKEKMLHGELYRVDSTLSQEQTRSSHLQKKFNDFIMCDADTKAVLKELLGSMGENVTIRAPFHCDYGPNIHLADGVYMNFSCVLLDVCEIRIGARTMFAPNGLDAVPFGN
uniref:Maltose/galactoside acetyltransferase domain-containing protein n=1 Tax=Globisporangium ultimum (strain ATCC 200006 / CBS 805.95 / DAOM BR144) TaxID=431595 RepID=K3X6E3_GLOUD